MSRHLLSEATAESGDGYSITVKAWSEDQALGEPCVANRGAADLVVTGPDGTTLSFRLPGEQAELIVRPLVLGAVLTESQADVARRYLREHSEFMYPEQVASLRRMAGYPDDVPSPEELARG